jgi:4-hydroxy-3-polyprenylbenzoate decarboxylase
MKYLICISGASGSIYGIRCVQELNKSGHEIHLIVSEGAKKILQHETSYTYDYLKTQARIVYENSDVFAGPSSGSFPLDGMVVIPCSMKTLSSVAHGLSDTLMSRAATCCLKEGKKVILVPRETPFDNAGIKNMLAAKENGAVILPAMPAFYHKPRRIEDLVEFIVGKIFDQLGLQHSLFTRWE